MTNFISKIRDGQFELAQKIAESLLEQNPIEDEVLRQDFLRDVMLSVRGYTDWMASRLWRKELQFESPIGLPKFDPEAVAQEFDIKLEVLSLVETYLASHPVTLPGLGSLEGGRITVDWEVLREWADYYDWTPVY